MHRLPPPPLPPVDTAAVPPLDGGQVVVPLRRLLHRRDDPVVQTRQHDDGDHTFETNIKRAKTFQPKNIAIKITYKQLCSKSVIMRLFTELFNNRACFQMLSINVNGVYSR